MVVHEVNGAGALSHLNTLPLLPDKVSEGPEEPEQTDEPAPLTEPATV